MALDEAIKLGQRCGIAHRRRMLPGSIIAGLVFAEQLEALVRWQGAGEATFERLDSLIDAIQFLL